MHAAFTAAECGLIHLCLFCNIVHTTNVLETTILQSVHEHIQSMMTIYGINQTN